MVRRRLDSGVSLLNKLSVNIQIRPEQPKDMAAIESVIVEAFRHATHASHTEQFIVRALRDSGQLSVSLVAVASGKVIGHVALSPVTISDGSAHWYGLGPVSVAPAYQGQGIGSQLVGQSFAQLHNLGASGCVVLGDPAYYARFGFKAKPSLVLPDVPPQYFQAIAFVDSVPSGTVSYHEAFASKS